MQAGQKAGPIQIVLSGAGRKLLSRVASIDPDDIETYCVKRPSSRPSSCEEWRSSLGIIHVVLPWTGHAKQDSL